MSKVICTYGVVRLLLEDAGYRLERSGARAKFASWNEVVGIFVEMLLSAKKTGKLQEEIWRRIPAILVQTYPIATWLTAVGQKGTTELAEIWGNLNEMFPMPRLRTYEISSGEIVLDEERGQRTTYFFSRGNRADAEPHWTPQELVEVAVQILGDARTMDFCYDQYCPFVMVACGIEGTAKKSGQPPAHAVVIRERASAAAVADAPAVQAIVATAPVVEASSKFDWRSDARGKFAEAMRRFGLA